MYSERQENWTRIASLVVSFIFVGFAIVLWWSLTVASIVLLVAAISIWIFSICNFEVYVEPTWIDTDATERRESKPREYRYGDPTDLEERISKMIEDELSSQKGREQYSSEVDTFDSIPIIEHSLPTGIIDGIGRNISNQLAKSGVEVLEDLAELSSSRLTELCDTDLESAERWIAEAKAIIVGARIKSIMDLSVAHDEEIYQSVSDAIDKGIISFPDDYEFTRWVVKRWIESAIHHMTSVEPDEIRKWFDREK
ncbi:MAG: helix-hairpin-helix domain-containing protein [Candidatus Thorarchaeota archaeon]|jgi:hypothetical protein